MKPVIEVRDLSKSYQITHQLKPNYQSLRDNIGAILRRPFGGSGHYSKETFWALKDVSFEVQPGEILGIIGKNGSGKSTLLKILSRIVDPSAGEVTLRGHTASLLEVGTGFHPELTGRENIYFNGSMLGMRRAEINKKFDDIVQFSEIEKFLDTPVKFYSSGMYVRLAFSVAAHLDSEILILDEVLSVGDVAFQKKSLNKILGTIKEGRSVIFVSHGMGAVEELCKRAIWLDKGKIKQSGPVQEVVEAYLGQTTPKEIHPRKSVVKRVAAKQVVGGIELELDYKMDKAIFPCFGFVISDHLGNKVTGANPLIYPPAESPAKQKKGTVKVFVRQPKLLNGQYRLSVWFGDGRQEFFYQEDYLRFGVKNMVTGDKLPASAVGPVAPDCEWEFLK